MGVSPMRTAAASSTLVESVSRCAIAHGRDAHATLRYGAVGSGLTCASFGSFFANVGIESSSWGDHETTTFPELAEEGSLRAFRHTGTWLTVNTPKELKRADEYVTAHPEWLA